MAPLISLSFLLLLIESIYVFEKPHYWHAVRCWVSFQP